MKYRLPFVFWYERFENVSISIISRFWAILNFPISRKNGASLELLNIVTVFENCLPKGSFGEIKKNSNLLNCMASDYRQLPTTALKQESFSQILLPTIFFVSFIARTLLVHNQFVFAMCLVGNRIKVRFEFYCSARFLSLRETPAHYSFITKQNNKNTHDFIGSTNNTNCYTQCSLSFFSFYKSRQLIFVISACNLQTCQLSASR